MSGKKKPKARSFLNTVGTAFNEAVASAAESGALGSRRKAVEQVRKKKKKKKRSF